MGVLSELEGSKWEGECELWLDPLGDEVTRSPCALAIDGDALRYTWSHEGADHNGSLSFGAEGAEFVDSWHQPEAMACRPLEGLAGVFQVQGSYGPDAEWDWRIGLSLRAPTDQLVLQMTNVAPWGEEARAVRMTAARR